MADTQNMKHALSIQFRSRALSLLVIITLLSFGVSAAFADDTPPSPPVTNTMQGDGTHNRPYQITSCDELNYVRNEPAASYILRTNLYCSDTGSYNNGQGFLPIDNFTGSFDGRNFEISYLTINSNQENVGLFSTLSEDASVRNLSMYDTRVSNSFSDLNNTTPHTGIIVGRSEGTISNIQIRYILALNASGIVGGVVGENTGTINHIRLGEVWFVANNSPLDFGGVAGFNSGDISNVYTNYYMGLDITATCGSIVGINDGGSITNSSVYSYMRCGQSNDKYTGGIAGVTQGADSIIANNVSRPSTNSTPLNGGIVGNNQNNIDLSTNLFSKYSLQWDFPNTPCDLQNSTCITTTDAYFNSFSQTQAPFDTWDFSSEWEYGSEPYLIWIGSYAISPLWVNNVKILRTTTTSATVGWSSYSQDYDYYNNNHPMTFEVGYTSDGTNFESIETTNFLVTINNLDPDLEYTFVVRPTNDKGMVGLLSEPATLPTKPEAPTSLNAGQITSGAVELSWVDDSNNTSISHYLVEYKKSNSDSWSTYRYVSSSVDNIVVSPLNESTGYDFRVAAVNKRGLSGYTNTVSATTLTVHDYTINSCEDLQNITNDMYGHYILAQDIDCANSNDFNDGYGFLPIGITKEVADDILVGNPPLSVPGFGGELDGAGHSITNLNINVTGLFGGLFHYIDGGYIHNLTLASGHVIGSLATQSNVYMDTAFAGIIVGTLSSFASNARIDNVTSNVNIKSNNTDGLVQFAGGLIGVALSSSSGIGATDTTLEISNVNVTGSVNGYASGGVVGVTVPVDLFGGALEILGNSNESLEDYLAFVGTTLNVNLTNVTSSGTVKCLVLCGGIGAVTLSDISLTNVQRSGITGEIGDDGALGGDSDTNTLLDIFGTFTGGLFGASIPLALSDEAPVVSLSNVSVGGTISGVGSSGLFGVAGPSVTLDKDKLRDFLNFIDFVINGGSFDFDYIMNTVIDFLSGVKIGTGVTTNNVNVDADISCVVMCAGAINLNLGPSVLNGVTINGKIHKTNLTGETFGDSYSNSYGSIFDMIAMFGPVTSGMVGINLPIRTLNSGTREAGLHITHSTVNADVEGLSASGLVAVNLPGIAIDAPEVTQLTYELITLLVEGNNNDNDTEWLQDLVSISLKIAGTALDTLWSSNALLVDTTTVNGDIDCTVICGGATSLSLGNIDVNSLTVNGNVTNDNTELIESGNPIAMCPIQITGGVVGAQLFFPLDVSNARINGNITVNEDGVIPPMSLYDVVMQIFGQTEGGYDENDSLGWIGQIICAAGATFQGTGGISGTHISPIDLSDAIADILNVDSSQVPAWDMTIDHSVNTGNITSNNPSATGGLVGHNIGKMQIANSSNSGTISNTTFAEMFRTPIASAATGGLVGHTLPGIEFGGEITDFVNNIFAQVDENGDLDPNGILSYVMMNIDKLHFALSYADITGSHSSGNIYSSNTVGGIVGTAAASTRINKSYSTGDLHGVTVGGIVGSGFNLGSPFGLLNLFSSIELNNTYSRANIYTSDDPETFTFAGGLVGMMFHFGEFKINNSYATGEIAVKNNATNTRLIAGGLIGTEFDLGFIPDILTVGIEELAKVDDLSSIDSSGMLESYLPIAQLVLEKLDAVGFGIRSGFSLTNSFSTVKVPAHSQGADTLLKEIALGDPEAYTTSGSLIGFGLSVDKEEIRRVIDEVIALIQENTANAPEGEDALSDSLYSIFATVMTLQWRNADSLAQNTYYDASRSQATACVNSLPSLFNIALDVLSKIGDGSLESETDIFNLLPKLEALGGTCASVNQSGNDPNYFKNTKTAGPLSEWDFNNVWYSHPDDFPTFEPDPVIEDNTNNQNNNQPDLTPISDPGYHPKGPNNIIPTDITPKKVDDAINTFDDIITKTPITKVLPKTITKNLGGKAAGKTPEKEKGLIPTIMGVMSATGAFLLRHLLEAILLMIIGAGIVYIVRNKKKDTEGKEEDPPVPSYNF